MMIGMTDSRVEGEVVDYGPIAEKVVTSFHITPNAEMEVEQTVRFEIKNWTLGRINRGNYKMIHCPYCSRSYEDTRIHCQLWIEDHVSLYHKDKLPSAHPLL